MPIRLSMRSYFSTYLLRAAEHLAGLAEEIERTHTGRARFGMKHRGFVLSSILAASNFLEAMPNELYQDAVDDHGIADDGYIAPLRAETRRTMAEVWRQRRKPLVARALSRQRLR